MNSAIRYYGGKGNMKNKIIEYFPNTDNYNTYIECFGGSFSLGLHELNIAPIKIYNDLEKNVYSLFKVLNDKNLFDIFKTKCDLCYYSEDIRDECKLKLKNNDLDIIERAFCFFCSSWQSHNSVGGFSINTVVRRNMSKSVSDYLSAIDRLPELHQKLSKVIVTNKDGIEIIKKYDSKNVFFYLDPPYHQSKRTSARYEVDMDNETQDRLIDTLLNLKNAKVLLSGYECDLYEKLEKAGWKKVQFEVNTVDGNRNPKTKMETLWFNY